MENEQETTQDEVNVDGGWLITHHTRTWDTRVRLDSMTDALAEKQAALADAQKAVDEEQARVDSFKTQIETAVALKAAPAEKLTATL